MEKSKRILTVLLFLLLLFPFPAFGGEAKEGYKAAETAESRYGRILEKMEENYERALFNVKKDWEESGSPDEFGSFPATMYVLYKNFKERYLWTVSAVCLLTGFALFTAGARNMALRRTGILVMVFPFVLWGSLLLIGLMF